MLMTHFNISMCDFLNVPTSDASFSICHLTTLPEHFYKEIKYLDDIAPANRVSLYCEIGACEAYNNVPCNRNNVFGFRIYVHWVLKILRSTNFRQSVVGDGGSDGWACFLVSVLMVCLMHTHIWQAFIYSLALQRRQLNGKLRSLRLISISD